MKSILWTEVEDIITKRYRLPAMYKEWKWTMKEIPLGPMLEGSVKIFRGLTHPELRDYIRGGLPFLYMDNSYFMRGPRTQWFRLVKNALHLTYVLDRPRDRIESFSIPNAKCPRPWKKDGRDVVVIPPSLYHVAIYDQPDWLENTVSRLREITDRPVVVKYDKKSPLEEALANAWCMVTYGSVAGVEAALMGIPVFSGPICPTLPISSGPIEKIETPSYPERDKWLQSLAYANYQISEIDQINFLDFDYQCLS